MRYYCRTCGNLGKARKRTPGSLLIELLLWILLIVPGLIYSIWRLSARHRVCRSCGFRQIIPETSPAAIRALAKTNGATTR